MTFSPHVCIFRIALRAYFSTMPVDIQGTSGLQSRIESVVCILFGHSIDNEGSAFVVEHGLVFVTLQAVQGLGPVHVVAELPDHSVASVQEGVIARAILELLLSHFEQLRVAVFS